MTMSELDYLKKILVGTKRNDKLLGQLKELYDAHLKLGLDERLEMAGEAIRAYGGRNKTYNL